MEKIMDPTGTNWDHCLQVAAATDLGLRRANNQDSQAVALASGREKWESRGHLFLVADGMGAHAAGELASKLASDITPLSYYKLAGGTAPEALLAAIHEANTHIYTRGQASDDFKGMGTTLSVLVLLPQGSLTAQVGDSRVYRWRNHRIEQLTFDHSLVWELRASGQFGDQEVPSYIRKNIITRSLGPNAQVQVDLEGPTPVQVGDVFLLCSDGLSGPVQDDEIGKIVGCLDPNEAVRALIDLANLRGGPDNITVIVVRVTAPLAVQEGAAAGGKPARPVHPLVWSLLGICGLAAVGLAASHLYLLALAALVGVVGSGIAAVVQRYSGGGEDRYEGRPLGKGPYTATDCVPDAAFVSRLGQIAEELRQAARAEDWAIDWSRFDAHASQGAAAAQAGEFVRAIREYCHAISFMMNELKNQRGRRRPGDTSSVDLL
jgi:protein phosphatase